MKNKIILVCVLSVLFLISGLVIGPAPLTAVSHVLAQDADPDDVLSPDSPLATNFILRIAGSALRPEMSEMGYTTSNGCIYATSNADQRLSLPLTLAAGSTIDQVRMYFIDYSASNSTVYLNVYDGTNGAVANEWSATTTGASDLPRSVNTVQIGHVIDYTTSTYTLGWKPVQAGDTMKLCSLMVLYKPAPFGFLPVIRK